MFLAVNVVAMLTVFIVDAGQKRRDFLRRQRDTAQR